MEYGSRCVNDGHGLRGGGDIATQEIGIPVRYR